MRSKFTNIDNVIISPTIDVREAVTLMKLAFASVARAFARRVFPVPGGPKSRIPLQGCQKMQHIFII